MPEIRCWHCAMKYDYDRNDCRPFIYHECNGVLVATRNPNFWNKPKKSYRTEKAKPKPKTKWATFE